MTTNHISVGIFLANLRIDDYTFDVPFFQALVDDLHNLV
jgi:hypothetical protein